MWYSIIFVIPWNIKFQCINQCSNHVTPVFSAAIIWYPLRLITKINIAGKIQLSSNSSCRLLVEVMMLGFLTVRTRALVLLTVKIVFALWNFWNFNVYFTIYWTDTRHVCTYFNAFFMVIPNMVMKFHNFEFCNKIGYVFDLSSALACHAESVKSDSCPLSIVCMWIRLF